MAHGLTVVGPDERAVRDPADGTVVYVLEVNPRASRTVPYVSKATGRPLAKIAARCMVGQIAAGAGHRRRDRPAVLLGQGSGRFRSSSSRGVDTILGPEMKSTGEVMGVGETFAEAFVKSQLAAGVKLPETGKVFISVKDADKPRAIELAKMLVGLGFSLVATARHGGGADGGRRAGDRRSTRCTKAARTSST